MKAHELNENVKVIASGCVASLTAGGGGDNSELTGEVIDRLGYESCVLAIPFKAVLATGESLAFTVKVAESDDGSSFGADETIASAVTAVTQAAGGTCYDTYKLKVKLGADNATAPRKRYLKFKVTPNLSASGTDTAIIAAVVLLGGAQTKPVAAWAAVTA